MEGGKPASQASGVKLAGTADRAAIYEVQSGRYVFSVPVLPGKPRSKSGEATAPDSSTQDD
jgi:hypothetical protein